MIEFLASVASAEGWLLRVAYPVTLIAYIRVGWLREWPLFCGWLLAATIHGAASGTGAQTAPYGDAVVGIALLLAAGEAGWKLVCWPKPDISMIVAAGAFCALTVAWTGADAYFAIFQPRVLLRSMVFGLSLPILVYLLMRPTVLPWRKRQAWGMVIVGWSAYVTVARPGECLIDWLLLMVISSTGMMLALLNWWWSIWCAIREVRGPAGVRAAPADSRRGTDTGSAYQTPAPIVL